MSKLRWTSKSSTKLADELVRQGFEVSSRSVLRLLHRLGYSLQANAKVTEGRQHPDRDAQFHYLNDTATSLHRRRPAGDLRRHEEEGADRRLRQRRHRMVTRRSSPNGSRSTTSPTLPSASTPRPSPMGSTTSPTTRAGSTSATPPTPPSSPSSPSGAGGTRWDVTGSPMPTAS